MKRSWLGFLLLLILLGAGLLAAWVIEDLHDPIADKLEAAAKEALQDNWTGAAWFAAEARGRWENRTLLRAALADHTPSEEVDALFAALEVYGTTRDRVAFAALSRELAEKITAIGEAHGLNWKNLL